MSKAKQKGILFSKLMMEANLIGSKNETRRIIKLPKWSTMDWNDFDSDGETCCIVAKNGCIGDVECPYGKPGDIIYAREAIWTHRENGHIAYEKPEPKWDKEYKCTPSIHMPKIHSRFWAELLEVSAARLLDITTRAAIAEGIEEKYNGWRDYMALCDKLHGVPSYDQNLSAKDSYFSLWDSINGKDSHLLNPWVWVLKYKEIPNPNL